MVFAYSLALGCPSLPTWPDDTGPGSDDSGPGSDDSGPTTGNEGVTAVAAASYSWCSSDSVSTTCEGFASVTPPGLPLSKIDGRIDDYCGLETDGTLHCWGSNDFISDGHPSGTFADVVLGNSFGCAIEQGGAVTCWGSMSDGQDAPPGGNYTAISAGYRRACGIRQTDRGELVCWGFAFDGEQPPDLNGDYTEVAQTSLVGCAIRADNGSLDCWGDTSQEAYIEAPTDSGFTSIVGSTDTFCALDHQGSAVCWGGNAYLSDLGAAPELDSYKWQSIDVGTQLACGITLSGHRVCFGSLP